MTREPAIASKRIHAWERNLLILVMFLQVPSLLGAYPPRLDNPVREPGQFQFQLQGETLGVYIVETSTNLLDWVTVATNQVRESQRVISLPTIGSQTYVRAIRSPSNISRFALAVDAGIELNGNDLVVDSYDSTDPLHSTPDGLYDPATATDAAELAWHDGLTNAAGVGSLTLFGALNTPGAGIFNLGPAGTVGTRFWVEAGNVGVQPAHLFTNLVMAFPEVGPPFTGGAFIPSPGIIDGELYDYVLNSGHYQMSSLNMSGAKKMGITGQATLYLTGSLSQSGTSRITILPGASLRLYIGGSSAVFGGAGVINPFGPEQVSLFCLPTVHSLHLPLSSGSMSARVYAPATDITLGNTNSVVDFSGSVTARSVTLQGPVRMHQDLGFPR